jgi:predicted HAD superfamily phosphohydrolase YqeG
METVAKWLAGITGLAIVATVVSNRNSPRVITSAANGIASIYRTASGR